MKGHRQRSPGRWAIVIDTRDDAGNRKRKWFSFSGNKRAAQVECARLISEITNGTAFDRFELTLREYLVWWLAHIETQVGARSCENYREVIQHWICQPSATSSGQAPARALAQAYNDALAHGGRKGTGLSPGRL